MLFEAHRSATSYFVDHIFIYMSHKTFCCAQVSVKDLRKPIADQEGMIG